MSKVGDYTIDSKILSGAISRAIGIVSLGEKSDTNVINMDFTKNGLAIEATNSIASYRTDIPVEISVPVSSRVSIIPDALLSYSKAYKELNLKPNNNSLDVSYKKTFSAQMFYVGNKPEELALNKPKSSKNDISKLAIVANNVLNLVTGIRNRTDGQPLGVIFSWGNNNLELTVGDTHHAIIIDAKVKQEGSNKLTTTLGNLQQIMTVGKNFAVTNDVFYAWSDTEYLSIANKTDNVFLADVARSVVQSEKKVTKVAVNSIKFRNMVDTLTAAMEETAVINFKLTENKLLSSISTSSGSAKASMKVDSFSGKELVVSVTIHHLRDCLTAMKEKEMSIGVFKNNMVSLESKSKEVQVVAVMTAVGK